jgi:hypothetical protein
MPDSTNERERRLREREEALRAEQEQFEAQLAQFNAVRSEFHTTAAGARDRLLDAWAVVESQQKRASGEWSEANRYFFAQTTALEARANDLARREKTVADRLAHAEAETAGLREEAAALEQRVHNSRSALSELEYRRDRARAELLGTDLPADLLASSNTDVLLQRELLLNRDKVAVAALRSALERESADLDDRRRLVAEQLSQLTDARAKWQLAERQTVVELEELARSLRVREQELDLRDRKLIRADVRRRADAYDLWQLRLRLEAWQAKLTAAELASVSPAQRTAEPEASVELAGLRAEVERLAVVMMEMELPEPPTLPESELPLAIEEAEESPGLLPFGSGAKAA